jgi:type IV secretory pathway VirB10-like protein
MKATLISLSLLIALLPMSRAIDVTTPDGPLKDIKVTKVEAEGVRVTHTEGTAFVDFDLLPPAMQAELGWTPEKSAARKAAKEAEAKRIADEEKMIEEAPKRKAMEEAAKKKAEEDKLMEEERAKRKIENAAFEADSANAQQDLIAAAAKARAELDRARKGIKGGAEEVPVAAVLGDAVKEITETPAPRRNVVTPPFGTVSDLVTHENPLLQNYKVMIGIGIGAVFVVILFMLPSSGPKKVRRR